MASSSAKESCCQTGLSPGFFGRSEDVFCFVAGFDELTLGDVLLGEIEGGEDHGFDLLVGEAVGGLDVDFGGLAGALLARGDLSGCRWRR